MGILLTVEGGEFTGKSSIIVPGIVSYYKSRNIEAKSSREPGGTFKGEQIREKIFERLREGASSMELAELFFDARELHLNEIIYPYIGKKREIPNRIIVLDRYLDTTRVLQGLEGGVSMDDLRNLEMSKAGSFYPDLTIITQIPENKFNDVMNTRRQAALLETSRSTTKWDEGDNYLQLQRQREYLSLPEIYEKENICRRWGIVDVSVEPHQVVGAGSRNIKKRNLGIIFHEI